MELLFLPLMLTWLLLRTILFKPDRSRLFCGLWGGSFNQPIDDMIIKKLKILGLFNQERGEDSCGYYNGVDLIKDADKNKKFVDFAVNLGIQPGDGKNNIFIGHARKSSLGAANLDNAHPFDIDGKLILAHNGTLKNHWSMANKYNIDHTNIYNDSRILGKLLVQEGTKILEEYTGAAALLLHATKSPNTLYVFHGASREFSSDKEPKEERPLFYMKTKEGVYVSSIQLALSFIREPGDEEPQTLPHNIVFGIRGGKFLKKKEEIYRQDANVYTSANGYWQNGKFVPYSSKNTTTTRYDANDYADADYDGYGTACGGLGTDFSRARASEKVKKEVEECMNASRKYSPVTKTNSSVGKLVRVKDTDNKPITFDKEGLDIKKEVLPPNSWVRNHPTIYYYRNRYYVTGTNVASDVLCHGRLIIDRFGRVHDSMTGEGTEKRRTYYFWRGLLLISDLRFEKLNEIKLNSANPLHNKLFNPVFNFARYMSDFSKYPVFNVLDDEATQCSVKADCAYVDGEFARGSIKPMWANRVYHFVDGKLKYVRAEEAVDTVLFLRSGTQAASEGEKKEETEASDGVRTTGAATRVPSTGSPAITLISLSEEFKHVKMMFHCNYYTVDQLDREFGSSHAYCALYLYMEDLMKKMGKLQPEPEQIDLLINELYERAVATKSSIASLMDKGLSDEDHYIAYTMMSELATKEQAEEEDKNLQTPADDTVEDQGLEGIPTWKEAEEGMQQVLDDKKKVEGAAPLSAANTRQASLLEDPGFKSLVQFQPTTDFDRAANRMEEEEMIQDDEAVSICEDIIKQLDELRVTTAQLNDLELSKFAERVASSVLSSLDECKKDMAEYARSYSHNNLARSIRDSMSAMRDVL